MVKGAGYLEVGQTFKKSHTLKKFQPYILNFHGYIIDM